MIELTVHGIPAPQGSKTPWGSEANPNTRPWRAAVATAAGELMERSGRSGKLLQGPLALEVIFVFPRPKSHYRTGKHAGALRPDAPVYHSVKPDSDKLVRAVGDSLTGQIVRDDAQFARTIATKIYGEPACARIIVTPLEQPA